MAGALISFTFDDGNVSTWENAFPILRQAGVPGNLAVVTDWVGGRGRYGWDQIAEMAAAGWEVVAHTRTHDLWNMTPEKIRREVADCRRILNERGYAARAFISPGGPWFEKEPEKLRAGSAYDAAVRETYEAFMSGGHAAAIALPADPMGFGRFGCECYDLEQFNAPLDRILAAIDEAVAARAWCHLGWHDVAGRHEETFRKTVAHARGHLEGGALAGATISAALGLK